MFDAKSLLEQLVTGAAKPAAQQAPGGGGGLSDILGQVLQGGGQAGGGLSDILGKLGQAGQGAGGAAGLEGMLRNMVAGAGSGAPAAGSSPNAGGGGLGLDELLGKLKEQAGQMGGGAGGNVLDTLGKVLSQATAGAKEGAGRIGEATGASEALGKAMGGRTPEDIMAQLKDLVAQNQLGAGAVLGGLGGLLLGTRTGRGVATGAVKLGALALIGGLAYKAYQNYEAGKPLVSGATAAAEAAPSGSGFEPEAVTNDSAVLIIRTMIAAAAADGRIDDNEKQQILSALGDSAGNQEAMAFVQRELKNPATPQDLASSVRSQSEALQIYTAARVAIESDSSAEKAFLANLAGALGIDAKLAAHIDATAKSQAA